MQAQILRGRLVVDSIASLDEASAVLKIGLLAGLRGPSTVDLGSNVGLEMTFDLRDGSSADDIVALFMAVSAINSNGAADPVQVFQRVVQTQTALVDEINLLPRAARV